MNLRLVIFTVLVSLLALACKKSSPDTPLVVAELPEEQFDNPVNYVQNPNFPNIDTALENLLQGKTIVNVEWQQFGDFYLFQPDTLVYRALVNPSKPNSLILSCLIKDPLRNYNPGIFEYDLVHNRLQLLFNTLLIVTELSMNENGDLLFIDNDNVWLWNTSLTLPKRVVTGVTCTSVTWKQNGTQIAVIHAYPLAQKQDLVFYSTNFAVDSFRVTKMNYLNLWPLDRYMIAQGYLYYDLDTDSAFINTINPNVGAFRRGCMTRKGELLYGTTKGNLASYNFGTKAITPIYQGYISEFMGGPSFSIPDSSVYFLSGKYYLRNATQLDNRSRIYKMGMNASNPTLIKEFR
ncbi:MAG: hypothetical protein EP332_01020 [Bacteroidetes bacterium]|nr:MAG: hypothetical protein EP332_01020 [Bacteroidota bacterium]